jgi:thioesterase domain-containing protein
MSEGEETIASAFAKAFVAAVKGTNANRERSERLQASASRGLRPLGLQDSDVVRVWRHDRLLGDFAASKFNWDLWCDYLVVSKAPKP